MRGKTRKKRVPQLKCADMRSIGWHVSYRDPETGTPQKHRFDATNKEVMSLLAEKAELCSATITLPSDLV